MKYLVNTYSCSNLKWLKLIPVLSCRIHFVIPVCIRHQAEVSFPLRVPTQNFGQQGRFQFVPLDGITVHGNSLSHVLQEQKRKTDRVSGAKVRKN
jgi:hypothetical protein